ncbi:MAG: Zn-ribbon domain-containing OB-fold protein [Dehalococcoidia bacterium]
MPDVRKPAPKATPETQEFWDGVKQGKFILQRCNDAKCSSKVYFPPRPFCPGCGSRDVSSFQASGRGKLASYVINHRPAPGFEAPYGICIVDLDEGPRLMTTIVGVEQTPENLVLDMAVELSPTPANDEISLPTFKPVGK